MHWGATGLAGDELNVEHARVAIKEATGEKLLETWRLVGKAIKTFVPQMGIMFEWFRTDGCGVDIAALRREMPEMQNFKTWFREDSEFAVRIV